MSTRRLTLGECRDVEATRFRLVVANREGARHPHLVAQGGAAIVLGSKTPSGIPKIMLGVPA